MRSPKSVIAKIKQSLTVISGINERFDAIGLNQGAILSRLNEQRFSKNLQDYEFRIFSQWGEDGILQHLTRTVDIKNKSFFEFGVENFFESNCRYLMMKDNWSGFVIDGSKQNIEALRKSYFYWRHDLMAVDAFITRENIDELLCRSGFAEDVGILSIDLDGNDYFVLEAVRSFKPRILVCEYNAVFGAQRKISVPYAADFVRSKGHYSQLYAGASLAAICYLADRKGYSLVGTNSAGNNAFFVRNDLLNDRLEVLSVEQAFRPSKFRESFDAEGQLSYLRGDDRLALIKGLSVLNVETQATELI